MCLALLCAGWPRPTSADDFDLPKHPNLTTLHASGGLAESFDIVITGDGYTASDAEAFQADAAALTDGLLAFGPYGESQGLINVHALFTVSVQAGADHPSQGIDVQTAFDATYESFGVAYLITANQAKVLEAVGAVVPSFDLAVLLVNDPAYGGSGGEVTMVSRAPESIAILRHELGHTIANLADEYEHPNPAAALVDPEPNVATAEHIQPPPWQVWIDPNTPVPTPLDAVTGPYSPIGAYEGARYLAKDMYRPAPNCLMRSLDHGFCPICREALLKGMAARSLMVRGRTPNAAAVRCTQGACPTFALTTAQVLPQTVRWWRDGVAAGDGPTWNPAGLEPGLYAVQARVRHDSPGVRDDADGAMSEQVTWSLQIDAAPVPAQPDAGAGPGGAEARVPTGCGATVAATGAASLWWGWLMAALLWCRRARRASPGSCDDRTHTRPGVPAEEVSCGSR